MPKIIFTDLLEYGELVIIGGEPILLTPKALEMIHRLRVNGYEGKIWLHVPCVKAARQTGRATLKEVDGITCTLHHRPPQIDLRGARKPSKYILDSFDNRENRCSGRLLVDNHYYTSKVLTVIGLGTEDS